jgi:hypothetical protein
MLNYQRVFLLGSTTKNMVLGAAKKPFTGLGRRC